MANKGIESLQLRTPEDNVILLRAMGAAGYAYDSLESTESYLRFFGEGGTMMTMGSWQEVRDWLEGVVFDEPAVSSHVEQILHPERYEKVNPLRALEDAVEQNDNSFDGIINNLPPEPVAAKTAPILDILKNAKEEAKHQHTPNCPQNCQQNRDSYCR